MVRHRPFAFNAASFTSVGNCQMDEPTNCPTTGGRDDFVILPDHGKLEALAEFAAGAGHEVNNPLATIIGRAQLLLKDERDPQRRQMLMAIGSQAYRIRDMIGDTMLFGRPPLPEINDHDLGEVVDQVLKKQADDLARDRCSVSVEIDSRIMIRADRTQFSILLSELLRNSRQALLPEGGVIRVSAISDSRSAIIEVTDHGKGFTDVERQHAFDPFFSGRQAGRGLGFGLCKCWRIVDLHSGQIEIRSSVSGPTTVSITWPLA